MTVRLGLLTLFMLWATSCSWFGPKELLIAVKPEFLPQLITPDAPDLTNTGLSSLDSLNDKWKVLQMTAVYPNVSADDEAAMRYGLAGVFKLEVPRDTDLETMLADYEADPTIDYAEPNTSTTIFGS